MEDAKGCPLCEKNSPDALRAESHKDEQETHAKLVHVKGGIFRIDAERERKQAVVVFNYCPRCGRMLASPRT